MEEGPGETGAVSGTISPVAALAPTFVILILTSSPGFAPRMNTMNPSILATPSPRSERSITLTLYSLPASTGFPPDSCRLADSSSRLFLRGSYPDGRLSP